MKNRQYFLKQFNSLNYNLILFLRFFKIKQKLKNVNSSSFISKRHYFLINKVFCKETYFYKYKVNIFTLFKISTYFYSFLYTNLFVLFFYFYFKKIGTSYFNYDLIFVFKLFIDFCFF